MDAQTLQMMQSQDGLYILSDEVTGSATIAVMVFYGRLFRLACDVQLSADPKTWRETTMLMGGPFSAQSCYTLNETIESLKDELAFWKDLAQRSRDAVGFFLGMQPVNSRSAAEAADILTRHQQYDEAERARAQMHATAPKPES